MRTTKSLLLAGAVIVGLVAGTLAAVDAQAAAGNGIDPASIVIQRDPAGSPGEPLLVGDTVRVSADWAVPNGTTAGHQFTMQLPAAFSSVSILPFPLEVAGGEPMGTCTVSSGTAPLLTCTLNSVVEGKNNVRGTVWVRATASGTTESGSVDFVIDGGTQVRVELPGGAPILPPNVGPEPVPDENLHKQGNYESSSGLLRWVVIIPPILYTPGLTTMHLTDQISSDGADHTFIPISETNFYLEQYCRQEATPYPHLLPSSASSFALSADGKQLSLTISAQEAFLRDGVDGPCQIFVRYASQPTDPVQAGQIFRNSVHVEGLSTTAYIVIAGSGGGTGDGDLNAGFSITKSVVGAAANVVPPGTTFDVTYTADGYPSGQLKVRADGTVVNSPLFATGTQVTVGEISPPEIPGVEWGAADFQIDGQSHGPRATFVVTAGQLVTLSIINTANTPPPGTGGFTVEKRIVGATVPGIHVFNVPYSYTPPGGSPTAGVLQLTPGGGPEPVTGIPAGSVVTLSESTPPVVDGVAWGTPEFVVNGVSQGETASFTIGAGDTIQVVLNNPATDVPPPPGTGGFQVVKNVTGDADAVPADAQFTVRYAFTADGTPRGGTLTLTKNGPPASLSGIPDGTQVTLSEATPPTLPGATWGTPRFVVDNQPQGETATFTIAAGTTVAIVLENPVTRLPGTGAFEVVKNVTGDAHAVPDGTQFGVRYSFTANGNSYGGTLQLPKNGPPASLGSIPDGTVVTLSEVTPPALPGVTWGTPRFIVDNQPQGDTATFTIAAGTTVAIVLDNPATEVPPPPGTGSFEVVKAVTGSGSAAVPDGTPFTVHYSYTLDGAPQTGTLTVTKGGAPVRITGLPAGTVVGFDEATPPVIEGVEWGTPVFAPGTVTIGADDVASVTLTNIATDVPPPPPGTGSFEVVKAVTGSGSAAVPDGTPFTVHYSYTLDGAPQTGTLTVAKGGAPVRITGLPAGTVVGFDEATPPVIEGVEWGTPVFSPGTVTIGADDVASVTLTNIATELTPDEGGFDISKAVTGAASGLVPPDTPFDVTYSYTANGTPVSGTVTITPGGGTQFVGPFPVGTQITLVEATPPPVPGVVWGTPSFTIDGAAGSPTFAIGAGTVVAVVLTNPAAATPPPGFSLTKTSDPPAGTTVRGGDTITYTVTGQNTGQTVLDPVVITDDLSSVLDHAVIVGTPGSSLGAPPTVSGTTLTWNGSLAAGQVVSIMYTVRLDADIPDGTIVNNRASGSATPPDGPPITPPDVEVEHPVPGFALAKTSNPVPGTSVQGGDTITYTVTGRNTGATVLDPVVITDDLAKVLSGAALTGNPTSSIAPSPVLNGTNLTWSGILQPGQSVVLTYTVRLDQGIPAGTIVSNRVSGSGTPPEGPPITPPDVETEHPVPGFALSKSSDPLPGTSVRGGDTITYTVSGSNTGQTALDPVRIVDDLSGVLQHATIQGTPTASLGAPPTLSGTTLTWTGALQLGETVRLVYTVELDADLPAGTIVDNTVSGSATPPEGPPIVPPDVETEHPVPGFTLSKGSDPEPGTTVRGGDSITYTLIGTNTGATVLDPVRITDDLSNVLAHAALTGTATAEVKGGNAPPVTVDPPALTGTTLIWAGRLEVGQRVEISYTVRLHDDVADGTIIDNVARGSAQPPDGPPLEPPEERTSHPVPGFTIAKTSDPAPGSIVRPGSVITYTVTATNTGATRLDDVRVTDDMSGVLSSASLEGAPRASLGEAPVVSGTTITWQGALQIGESVVITYSVRVAHDAVGVTLHNRVTGTATPPGTPPIVPPPVTVEHSVLDPALASTGMNITVALFLTFLLVGGGAILTGRRRNRSRHALR